MKSKSTLLAYLLFIFLGQFGVHNFYLKKWVWGGVYLGLAATCIGALFHLAPLLLQQGPRPSINAISRDPFFQVFTLAGSILNLFLIWDLFTLWLQVRRYGESH